MRNLADQIIDYIDCEGFVCDSEVAKWIIDRVSEHDAEQRAEIDRLQTFVKIACKWLTYGRHGIVRGWNNSLKKYGYFLRGVWAGENIKDVLSAAAAVEEAKEKA